ncbi:MAG: cation:proton antiporter [Pseudomonadota bacterium]
MSSELGLLIFLFLVFAFALVSRRLGSTGITAPMIFLGGGWLCAHYGLVTDTATGHGLSMLAEAALVILLFADAAMISPRDLFRDAAKPGRMLVIGLPIMIALGFVAGLVFLPGWPIWEIALLAALLAPTDAALGQAVVTNPAIPEPMRRALSAESGLNDGLALPFVVFFGCLAVGGVHDQVETGWIVFVGEQIGFGVVAGVLVGGIGGYLLRLAQDKDLSGEGLGGLAVFALAGLSYLVAHELEGNGFIAAFVAGLSCGEMLKGRAHMVFEFLDTEGQLVSQLAFFAIGALLLPVAFEHATVVLVLYILLSLIVLRPVAIWLSLPGVDTSERLFFGWFGPRGLATALFALLVLEAFEDLAMREMLLAAAGIAVVLSAVLHGASAAVVGRAYARAQS